MEFPYSLCEEDAYKRQNLNCWIGNHLGEYRQEIIDFDQQKYNPAVQQPVSTVTDFQTGPLHMISDKLIQLRYAVLKPVSWYVI